MKCQYCKGEVALFGDSSFLYHGKNYGPVWVCTNYPQCNSYVGCHPGTITPLGSVANKELRLLRKQCHKEFDKMWKFQGYSRIRAYEILSQMMHIKEPHIGEFDIEQCQQLLNILGNSSSIHRELL